MADAFRETRRAVGLWLGTAMARHASSVTIEAGPGGLAVAMTMGDHRARKAFPPEWEGKEHIDFGGWLDEMVRGLMRASDHGNRDDS